MAACNCNGTPKFLIVRNNAGQTVTVDGASGRFFIDACGVTTLRYSIQQQGVEMRSDVIQNAVNNNYYIDLIGLQAGIYNFVLTSELNSNAVGCTGTDSGFFTIGTVTTLPANTTLQSTTVSQTTQPQVTQPGQTTKQITTTIPMASSGLAVAVNDVVKGGQIGVPQVVDVSVNDISCPSVPEFKIGFTFGCNVTVIVNGRFQVVPTAKTWYFIYSILCDGNASNNATVVGTVTDQVEQQGPSSSESFNIQSVSDLTFACIDGFLTVSGVYKNVASLSIKENSKVKVTFTGVSGQASSNVGEIKFGYLTFNQEAKQNGQFTILIVTPHDCSQPINNVSICLQL